jgi:hypothetical protein
MLERRRKAVRQRIRALLDELLHSVTDDAIDCIREEIAIAYTYALIVGLDVVTLDVLTTAQACGDDGDRDLARAVRAADALMEWAREQAGLPPITDQLSVIVGVLTAEVC